MAAALSLLHVDLCPSEVETRGSMWGLGKEANPLLAFILTLLPPPDGTLWLQRGLIGRKPGCEGSGSRSRAHLEVRKVLRHKVVDLADRKAPSFTVLKGHEDEDAGGRENPESFNP